MRKSKRKGRRREGRVEKENREEFLGWFSNFL